MPLPVNKDYDVVTVLAATTTAAGAVDTAGSAVPLPSMVNALVFILNVTAAATDAADTLDVGIETKLDGSNWVDAVAFTQVLGNGGALKHIAKIEAGTAQAMFKDAALAAGSTRNLLGDEWRVTWVQVDADSDASFSFSVTAMPM